MVAECIDTLESGGAPARDDQRICFSENAATPKGKVAMLFPGMAFPGLVGNFPAHMLQMALHFPELREVLDGFEGKDGNPEDPMPLSCILSPPRSFDRQQRELLKKRVAPPHATKDKEAPS